MSKDPAILFYTSDFLTGTVLMTHEQVGIYIRLICILHQHGGEIDLAAFEAFIGQHDIIRSKFDFKGKKVFNKRLLEEMTKRNAFCQSRRDNASGKASAKHKHKLMENENDNEIVIRNDNRIEDKKQPYGEFAMLTVTQFESLIKRMGRNCFYQYLERLNNYIGSKGAKYKSHSHTILSWWNKDNKPVNPKDTAERLEREQKEQREQWEKDRAAGDNPAENLEKLKGLTNFFKYSKPNAD